jgi:hypothetical protein
MKKRSCSAQSTSTPLRSKRWQFALAVISVLLVSCMCTDLVPLPTSEPSPLPTSTTAPPIEPPPEGTEPPQTESTWDGISGMWSGCPQTAGADVFAEACTLEPGGYPLGNFLTMFLLPTCSVGEMCGSYVKGRFDSEFILYHLTLIEIQGDKVIMFGDAGGGMFEGMNMDVEIERVGPNLRVADTFGESYILPPGCDTVIDTAFQCWDTVP